VMSSARMVEMVVTLLLCPVVLRMKLTCQLILSFVLGSAGMNCCGWELCHLTSLLRSGGALDSVILRFE